MPRLSWDVAMIDPPWPKLKGGLRKQRPNQGRRLVVDEHWSIRNVIPIRKLRTRGDVRRLLAALGAPK